jgi:predicted Zn-ribbon and HTH transcriptional regulator
MRAAPIEPEWVVAYTKHGMSVNRIAVLTKRHPITIKKGLQRAGVKIRGRRPSKLPSGDGLLQMRESRSVAEIAEEHGVSEGYIRAALGRAKRELPKRLQGMTFVRCSECGKRMMAGSVSLPAYCPRCTALLVKE